MQTNLKLCLKFKGIFFDFVIKLNIQIAEVIVLLYSENCVILLQPFGHNAHNFDDRAAN